MDRLILITLSISRSGNSCLRSEAMSDTLQLCSATLSVLPFVVVQCFGVSLSLSATCNISKYSLAFIFVISPFLNTAYYFDFKDLVFCFCGLSLIVFEKGILFFCFSIWSKTTCSLFFFPIIKIASFKHYSLNCSLVKLSADLII